MHPTQAPAPVVLVLNLPNVQEAQALTSMEEVRLVNCPAAQAVQFLVPVERLLYVPTWQPLHTDDVVAAMAMPKAPAGQAVQLEAPMTPL